MLNDAVDLVPDSGYINNPNQRRTALHNKISALERMIEEGDIEEAIEKLRQDIARKFRSWLVDGYEVETPLQLSKQEALDLVAALIGRLETQQIPGDDDGDEADEDDQENDSDHEDDDSDEGEDDHGEGDDHDGGDHDDDDGDGPSAKRSLEPAAQDRPGSIGCGAFSPAMIPVLLIGLCLMRLVAGRTPPVGSWRQ